MSYIDAQNNFLRWGVLLKTEERKPYIFLTLKLWDGDVDWNVPFSVLEIALVKYNTMVFEVCTRTIFQIHFLYFRCNAVHFYLNNKKKKQSFETMQVFFPPFLKVCVIADYITYFFSLF